MGSVRTVGPEVSDLVKWGQTEGLGGKVLVLSRGAELQLVGLRKLKKNRPVSVVVGSRAAKLIG